MPPARAHPVHDRDGQHKVIAGDLPRVGGQVAIGQAQGQLRHAIGNGQRAALFGGQAPGDGSSQDTR